MVMTGLTGVMMSVVVATGVLGDRAQERQRMNEPQHASHDEAASKVSQSGHDIARLGSEEIDELARQLSPDERRIILDKGTERAFTGKLLENKADGVYVCRLCSLPLFASGTKFDSGSGWPSFFRTLDPEHVAQETDAGLGMVRTEIMCARCRSHVGHVFDDGPEPTGLRYCTNSAALSFVGNDEKTPASSGQVKTEVAYFAGGCFWGVEDRFQRVPGVIDAVSGYMGGETANPTYEQVCSGTTHHAEAVRVTYDHTRVSFKQLLEWFFKIHNPTQRDRQGVDVGSQYRSAIFAASDEQLEQANEFIQALQGTDEFQSRKIVTQVEPAGPFFEAEEYHQDYHAKHGGSCALPTE